MTESIDFTRVQRGECAYCGSPLPSRPAGRRGPASPYCNQQCRNKAKHRRTYVPSKLDRSRPGRRKYDVGHRFGDLVVIEHLGQVNGSSRLRCRCDCGTVADYNLSNLRTGQTARCANREFHPHPLVRKTPPTDYDAAHRQVRKAKGRASAFICRCGKRAEQWAYTHSDLDVQHDTDGREAGRPFSPDPAHYVPMCRSCHIRYDRARRRFSGGGKSLVHHVKWLVGQVEPEAEAS